MRAFLKTYGIYLAVTIAVMAPLLMPGYILTLDLTFTPELRMPQGVSHDYLWHTLLHVLNLILPSQIIEKAILAGAIFGAAVGMHQLVRYLQSVSGTRLLAWEWPLYAASIFFAINPFTYTRFMAGQYAVLAGYAFLPFFVRLVLQFIAKPDTQSATKALLVAIAVSIVSIHTVGELAVIVIAALLLGVVQHRRRQDVLHKYVRYAGGAVVAFIMLSSYWLVPLAFNQGETAKTIEQFNAVHADAFATNGDTVLAQIVNVLKLQGFWADKYDLYLLPQDQIVGWGTIRLIIWGLVAYGMVVLWRVRRSLAACSGLITVVAVLLAVGIPDLTQLGYREPQKFVGLVALCFAIFLAFGSARLLQKLRDRSETNYLLGAIGILLVVVLFTPTMYWGGVGQLKPRQYPADWQRANEILNKEAGTFNTLFLPWHQYMSFDFAGRIIASPAENYFDTPVIVSNNPELRSLQQSSDDPRKATLNRILTSTQTPKNLTAQLARYEVQYILLAKDYDYKKYRYLGQENVTVIYEGNDLILYRNNAFKEAK